jgi:two-component system, cell cycle response regulator
MEQLNPIVYRLILETVPSGICAVDREDKIIFWNEAAEKMTGHLRQDVLGGVCDGKFLEHMDADNNLLIGDSFPVIEAMRSGRGKNGRASLRSKNGHFVMVKLHTVPFRDENGRISGAVENF